VLALFTFPFSQTPELYRKQSLQDLFSRPSDDADIIAAMAYNFQIETDREEDGRWIAEIPDLPGALAYGASREDAIRAVEALALRVLADKLEASKEILSDPFAITMASSVE
jgi:predicted RNase H-like HicB family nuclease